MKQKENLRKENEELKKQVEEFKNKYLRALADYQNYEKRVGEEKSALRHAANKELLLKLLTVTDDLEKAEVFIKDKGLKIIYDKFNLILSGEGVKEMNLKGSQFDPNLSEAIEIVEGKEDNKIAEVLRKGYTFNGKVLRIAQVRVTKKSEARNPKPETRANN